MFKNSFKIAAMLLVLLVNTIAKADEGMWPLTMVAQLEDKMKAAGLNLSASDIYSINQSCLKDAVVRLMAPGSGRMFCSGEVVSNQGLFLTNHHCGYGAIQGLSTNEDNILTNGFWAKDLSQERPASQHLNIGFLRKIEEVTGIVTNGIDLTQEEAARNAAIKNAIIELKSKLKASLGDEADNYQVDIIAFNNNNRYMAMYYEVFKDIRLVGTPPESIGKFGGETDNWRWPRHTGDFSMFRIYANADNKPTKEYSPDNKPYTPKMAFKVSIKGVKNGDYAMIMGYPGTTQRYTYSEGIRFLGSKERPMRVALRRSIMDVYETYMKASPSIRLMYSDKLAGLGNYWNKFNGEAHDLSKPGLYEKSKTRELEFERWVRNNNKGDVYGEVTSLYDEAYAELNKIGLYGAYFADGIRNSGAMMNALMLAQANKGKTKEETTQMVNDLKTNADERFKEYYDEIEVRVLEQVLRHIYQDLDNTYFGEFMKKIGKKYHGDYAAMAAYFWKKSAAVSKDKFLKSLGKAKTNGKVKDPLAIWVSEYMDISAVTLKDRLLAAYTKLARANRLFSAGMLEKDPNAVVAPDANATMRLTYGNVMSYNGNDAVSFKHYTTAQGILEKFVPGDFEFDAPTKLIDMLNNKEFGQYADADGTLHTCFLSNNDITGGNSGSPVLNANGELIGIAFDGNFEAISSDFGFIPDKQRTISVDIRYVLWTIDIWGGARNLIDEMTLAK